MTTVLGIDLGGTGIKGAPVDTRTGQLLADRHRILTPQPATPDAVAEVVGELAKFFDWTGPSGATFPAVSKHGVATTAANVGYGVMATGDAASSIAAATAAAAAGAATGAGAGELVYWVRGKEASFPFHPDEPPVDTTIVGIVDEVHVQRTLPERAKGPVPVHRKPSRKS